MPKRRSRLREAAPALDLGVIVANVNREILPGTVCGQPVSQQIGGDGTIELAKDSRKENARLLGVFFPEKPLDGDRSVRDVEQG